MISGDMRWVEVTDVDCLKRHDIRVDIRPFISCVDDGYCYCGEVIIDKHIYKGFFTKCMFRGYGFIFK